MRNFNEELGLSLAFFVALLFPLGGGGPLHAQSDSGYGIAEAKSVMVAMRVKQGFAPFREHLL